MRCNHQVDTFSWCIWSTIPNQKADMLQICAQASLKNYFFSLLKKQALGSLMAGHWWPGVCPQGSKSSCWLHILKPTWVSLTSDLCCSSSKRRRPIMTQGSARPWKLPSSSAWMRNISCYIKDDKVIAMKSRAVAHVLDKCHISARLKLPSHSDRPHRGEAEGKLPLYQPVQTTQGSFFQKSSSIANTGLTNQRAIEAELKSNLQAPNSETNPPPKWWKINSTNTSWQRRSCVFLPSAHPQSSLLSPAILP